MSAPTHRRPTRWIPRLLFILVLSGLGMSACAPEPVAFPMPDTFPQPIDTNDTIPAPGCAGIETLALEYEPHTEAWARIFRNALWASAARTLIANPEIASIGSDAEVATGNPWYVNDDVFEMFSDEDYWTALCDTGYDQQAYAGFVAIMYETSIMFLDNVITMTEPALEPYQDLL